MYSEKSFFSTLSYFVVCRAARRRDNSDHTKAAMDKPHRPSSGNNRVGERTHVRSLGDPPNGSGDEQRGNGVSVSARGNRSPTQGSARQHVDRVSKPDGEDRISVSPPRIRRSSRDGMRHMSRTIQSCYCFLGRTSAPAEEELSAADRQ